MGWSTKDKIDAIIQKTRSGGSEIVSLLKTGSAFYAPAISAIVMAKSYLFNKRKVLLCTSYLNGQYNENGIYTGVPVILGKNGVEKIVEISLNTEELNAFSYSVSKVRELINLIKTE